VVLCGGDGPGFCGVACGGYFFVDFLL